MNGRSGEPMDRGKSSIPPFSVSFFSVSQCLCGEFLFGHEIRQTLDDTIKLVDDLIKINKTAQSFLEPSGERCGYEQTESMVGY